MKKLFIVSMVLLVCFSVTFGQETTEQKAKEKPVVEEQVKGWQLPPHMQESLRSILNQKVGEFKIFLRANVKGYEDMPDNVVFDFASGIFLTPESITKLQARQKKVPAKK